MSTDELARMLWDYMRLGHAPAPADVILVLGSNDVRVGEHGARLFLRGLAPLMVCSRATWAGSPPAASRRARRRRSPTRPCASGCRRSAILIEDTSTNTGENIDRSRALLASAGVQPVPRHPGAEAVHGAPRVGHLQAALAGARPAGDLAADPA
ncbi:MAG: YdcF family protein [Rhodopseudomonas palustris]|nr:YdcF family protein [Rhodopseudomonas palustris]